MADIFSVVAMVGGALLLVFLVVAAIYFYSTMNNQFPVTTQSTAMFWLSILWMAAVLGFVIWAFVRLFTSPISNTPTEVIEYENCETETPEYQPVKQVKMYAPSNQQQGFASKRPVPANYGPDFVTSM